MTESTIAPRRYKYWEHPWLKWIGLGMLAMVYFFNRSPHVGFNDGLSFLLEAEQGWSLDTNATSHFLYNNIQHLLLQVFSFMDSVLVLVMFSIVSSLLTLIRIYQIGRLLIGPVPVLVMPVIALALSFTFWQQTEIIEVYAFNNFLFSSFLYFALKDLLRHEGHSIWWVSLFLGLGIITHIQTILAVPFFCYYLYRLRSYTSPLHLAGAGAITLGLSSILFILPSVTGNHPISAVFFDSQFQDEVLGFDMSRMMQGMGKAMMFMMYNFHMFLIFVVHGWILMWRNRRQTFWQFTLLLIPFMGFAIKYSVADNHVFFLVPYLIMLPPMVLSMMALAFKLMPYMNWMFPMMLMMSPMMYMGMTMMGKDHPRLQQYQMEKAYKGGVKHLLWPGKSGAPDPLAAAKKIYQEDPATDPATIEWNYEAAVSYLKFKGEL